MGKNAFENSPKLSTHSQLQICLDAIRQRNGKLCAFIKTQQLSLLQNPNTKEKTIKHAEKLLKINLKNEKVENLCELMFNDDLHPNKDKLLTTLITVTKQQIWKKTKMRHRQSSLFTEQTVK
ncbi:unnamed protein product [Clavelina lepadiformis]|uniref:Uncharacterized protein n=1 Tax=Clavelina lepadiformis TaxID=159417 RepID=A0ABP0FS82_CLALP